MPLPSATLVVLAAVLLSTGVDGLADALSLRRLATPPPGALRRVYGEDRLARAVDYARTRLRFGLVASIVRTGVLLGFWGLGGFALMVETLALARELDQPLALLGALPAFITTLLARGERDRAEAELPAYDALLARFPQPLHRVRRCLLESILAVGHLVEVLAAPGHVEERAAVLRGLALADVTQGLVGARRP